MLQHMNLGKEKIIVQKQNKSHVRLITTDCVKRMADFPMMSVNHLCFHCCCMQTATSLCKIKEIKTGTLSSSVTSNYRPHGLWYTRLLAHAILQARIMDWIAIPFSRLSFQPRDRAWVSCISGEFFRI